MRTPRTQIAGVALAVLLAACGTDEPEAPPVDDTEQDGGEVDPDDQDAGGDAADATSDEPAEEPGDIAADDDIDPIAGDPSQSSSEQEGTWGDELVVTDVRIGTHDGFDRVVFELEGDGTAGWFIDLNDAPVAQGSGQPIEVEGTTALAVSLTSIPLPLEGEDLPTPDAVTAPEDALVVTEVVEDSLFEGQHRFVIGLESDAAYLVERFDDPQRVVIEVFPDA